MKSADLHQQMQDAFEHHRALMQRTPAIKRTAADEHEIATVHIRALQLRTLLLLARSREDHEIR